MNRTFSRAGIFAALAAVACLARVSAQDLPARRPIELGPAVGSRVPDFSAPDQDGRTRTLQSLRGPKGTLLLFFRSADW